MVSGRLRPPPLDATDINDFQELVAGASRRASTIVTPKREPPRRPGHHRRHAPDRPVIFNTSRWSHARGSNGHAVDLLMNTALSRNGVIGGYVIAIKTLVDPHGRVRSVGEEDLDLVATLVAMSVDAAMALRDVKNRLSEVVDQVQREHDRVVITRHGKAAAVVISTDDLESLEETLKVVSRPKLVAQVRDSLAELAAGEAEVLSKEEILATLRP